MVFGKTSGCWCCHGGKTWVTGVVKPKVRQTATVSKSKLVGTTANRRERVLSWKRAAAQRGQTCGCPRMWQSRELKQKKKTNRSLHCYVKFTHFLFLKTDLQILILSNCWNYTQRLKSDLKMAGAEKVGWGQVVKGKSKVINVFCFCR